jgi:tight adherence protein B
VSRRILLAAALAALGAAGWAVPAGAQQEAARITGTDTRRFPTVTVTFAVPGQQLDPAAVQVTENGTPVNDLRVQPIAESTTQIDAVLAIDVSLSMREEIDEALAAARAFVDGLPSGSRVGVLTFSGDVEVVTPLTPNLEAVRAELQRGLEVAPGTALFDALVQATEMFEGEGQRNIVLLANGPNNVGETRLSDAQAAAERARATIYSVAFRGGEADVLTMRRLADNTGGTYSSGQLAELSSLYEAIASQLSSQYVATYTSTSPFGSELALQVTGPGFATGEVLTLAPKRPRPAGSPPTVEPAQPLLRGTWGLAVVVFLVFGAAFLLAVMLVGTSVRVRREREAAARMTAVARPHAAPTSEGERVSVAWIPDQMIQVGQRVAQVGGFAGMLDHKLEQAGLPLRAGEFVAATVIGALGGAILSLLLFQNLVLVLVFTVAGALAPWALLSRKLQGRKNKLNRQLPEVLNIMASSLRAGYSFLQALDTVAKQIPEPAAGEFNRTIAEIRLGRNVEEALNAMAERVGSDNFRWAVLAVNIQREVGGNLAEILDTVAHTVRERDELLREVDVLTTEGKISMYVLIALPILLTVYMLAVNREYISLLYTTRVGFVMLITGVSLLALGFVWIKRLVRLDV